MQVSALELCESLRFAPTRRVHGLAARFARIRPDSQPTSWRLCPPGPKSENGGFLSGGFGTDSVSFLKILIFFKN